MKAVEEEAARLAFVVASVAAVIDPALIVLGGGIGTNTDLLQPPLEQALSRTIPTAPRIVKGELGETAVLTGAIATALDTARHLVFERRGQVG
jgi:predicted NBD/HSP70 family sugar kinase